VSISGFDSSRVAPTRILSSRAVGLTFSLLSLAILSACTSNGGSLTATCPGATGSYSNSSLAANSQWTYQLSGWFLNGSSLYQPYTAAGVFTADGAGNLTGRDDFFGGTFTGAYSISADGSGSINISLTSGTNSGLATTWAVTLSNTSPGSIYLIEADPNFNASGTAYQQTTAAFNAAPSGKFVYRIHELAGGTGLAGSAASVGVMTVAGGNVTGLAEDVLLGLSPSQQGLAGNGTFGLPDTSGTGSVTITDSTLGITTSYNYYVIDANTFLLYDFNSGVGTGRAESQSAIAFSNSTLPAGSGFVLGSRGDTNNSGAGGVNSVGQFSVDGAGNITSGSYDTALDGAAIQNASITTGAQSVYGVAANGRTTVSLNANGNVVQQILYLVSASRGFFLDSTAANTSVEDGTLEAQVGSSFTASNFTGQSAFVMGGSTSQAPLDRTGTLSADGKGNLGWAEVANSGGSINTPGCLSGTYTVATNGRVLASINNLSPNMVFYLVSPSKSYVLQGDASTEMFGGTTLQASPVMDPPGGF
jgi:hypothetical protein